MAQTGFTPIQIYSSSTTGNTPAAGNLLNSSAGSELAINIFDGKLFYKDSSGNVQVIGWKVVPVSAGGTGQTSYTDGQLLIGNSTGNTLTKATLTAGSGVTITNGAGAITINATGSGGTVTSVSGTAPISVATGTTTPVISISQATTSTNGYLSSTDWNTFNSKGSGTVTSVGGTGTVNGLTLTGTVTTTGNLTLGGTLDLSSPPTIGNTTANTITGTTITASTKFAGTNYDASSSAGGNLRTASGTACFQWGAGGGVNCTVDGSINMNGANAHIDMSPTGTGHVSINPTGVGDINNVIIGATTPLAITGTTITATTFSGSGASLTSIPNSALVNSTISGVALGGSLFNLTAGTGVSFSTGTTYNGSTAITINATGTGGTVTSVAALTLGTTGTDLSSTVANGTTTPVITLNVPTASAANRGALSSTDWSTFNGKQAALVSGTNIKTVSGVSLLGSGDVGTIGTAYGGTGLTSFTSGGAVYATSTSALTTGTLPVASGGTGQTTFTAGRVLFGNGTSGISSDVDLFFDGSNLGIGTSSPNAQLTVHGASVMARFRTGSAADGRIEFAYNTTDTGYINMPSSSLLDIYARSGVSLAFGANGSEAMRLTSTGLGIGTSSPGVKLDVSGANGNFIRYTSTAGVSAIIGDGSGLHGQTGTTTNHPFVFITNATERMRLDSAGNLGLGVTPSAWYTSGYSALQVGNASLYGRNSQNSELYLSTNVFDNTSGIPKYITSDYATRYEQNDGVHKWFTAASGTAGNTVTFSTTMTLDASGNLGVGTTSPTERLHVSSTTGALAKFTSSASGAGSVSFVCTNVATPVTGYVGANAFSDNIFGVGTSTSTPVAFFTNGTERARIDSSGNLLVGTTNSSDTAGDGIKLYPNNGGAPSIRFVGNTASSSVYPFMVRSSSANAFKTYIDYVYDIKYTL